MYAPKGLTYDYVNKDTFFDFRMYAIHTDSLYTDLSRTVFKSTIRIFKYWEKYVRNDKFLKPAASKNSAVHSYPAISGFPHVKRRGPENYAYFFRIFGHLSMLG